MLKNGQPTGEYEDFLAGLVINDKSVWARPVGVAVAQDGSLLVSEDGNGSIWHHDRRSVPGRWRVPRDTTKVSRPPHVAFADCR